jgi:tellurite resistance protein
VTRKLRDAPSYAERGVAGSILKISAASYGFAPTVDELTMPTGFDPRAAALFEAIVESAYLVAVADGEFDDSERSAFEHVVISACDGVVTERQMHGLIADLQDQLAEDGVDKRVKMVARTITKAEHAREALRISALLAHVSGGVSSIERDALQKLALAFGLEAGAVASAVTEVEEALSD